MEKDNQAEAALLLPDERREAIHVRGLWESWHGEDKPLETSAILTTDANELAMEVA
jgi:putative SOS response-associated peptidase YedK